jgi:Domain of unknown function (DUF3850)
MIEVVFYCPKIDKLYFRFLEPTTTWFDQISDMERWGYFYLGELIRPEYFVAVLSGRKKFEVRINDRDFKEGDKIYLKEYSHEQDKYSGRQIEAKIGYILDLEDFSKLSDVGWRFVVFSLLDVCEVL